jgi:hypothetical protein
MQRDINRTQVFRLRVRVVRDRDIDPDLLNSIRQRVNPLVSGFGCELRTLEFNGNGWVTGEFRMKVGASEECLPFARGIVTGLLLSHDIRLP